MIWRFSQDRLTPLANNTIHILNDFEGPEFYHSPPFSMYAASPKLCRTVRLICPRQPEAPGLSLSTYKFSNPLAFLGPRLVFGASEPSLSLRSHLCRTLLSSIPVCPLLSFPETVLWSLFCGFHLLGLPEPVPGSGGHLAKAFKAFFSATFPQVLPHSSDTGLESFDVGFRISSLSDTPKRGLLLVPSDFYVLFSSSGCCVCLSLALEALGDFVL